MPRGEHLALNRLRAARVRRGRWITALAVCGVLASAAGGAAQSLEHGLPGPSYPDGPGDRALTGEKPESKVWWNHGRWWGSLWSTQGNAYHIWYLDPATSQWVDTGTRIDPRPSSKADVLWDATANKLYVASHVFTTSATSAPAGHRGQLFRYTYSTTARSYSLDAGFPVEVNQAATETLVLAKDSTGQLWVAYVQDGQVMVNRSAGSDASWGTPFVLPAGSTADVGSDDIASIVAFDGHIGVMWSNQGSPSGSRGMYFAAHPDSAADTQWWTSRRIYSFSQDDHISLKALDGDPAGRVFAAIKTSNSARLVSLLVCEPGNAACTGGEWIEYPVYRSADVNAGYDPTRPIVVIDAHNRDLYVFTRNRRTYTERGIYFKKVRLDSLIASAADSAFSEGIGTPFIAPPAGTNANLNDPTSSKQNLTAASGLLVLASDVFARRYAFNHLPLTGPSVPVAAFSGSPRSGTGPLGVTFTDQSTGGPTSWAWTFGDGGSSTAQHPTHTYQAAGTYTVTLAVANGAGKDSETKVGYVTVSESGPAPPGGGGAVTFAAARSGAAGGSATVETSTALGTGQLFLAAVASRPYRPVTTVAGLGLSWTRVAAQCAGRNQTGLEVWVAQGTPASGVVTATLSASATQAVITVSAYTGAAADSPVGAVVSGNTNGTGGGCSGGTDSATYGLTLPSDGTTALVYSAATMRNRTHTPGTGFTERQEVAGGSGGDMASVATQDRAAGTTADGQFSGAVDWAAVAIRIRPQ